MKVSAGFICAILIASTAQSQEGRPRLVPPCTIALLDTIVYKSATTYRDCDVDMPAKLITAPRPKVALQQDPFCVFVELEFAVDEEGRPVKATARALSGNSRNFTRITLATLSDWVYAPAMKDGIAVRQAVRARVARENDRMLTVTVRRPGEWIPPSPPDRPCK